MANTYNFSDVFISYSRKDSEFAKRLGETMKTRGYEIWADWEDIPQTVEWWNEIKAGIASAKSFIFIISPSAIESDICRDEIAYAADNNKRIIPILYRQLSDDELDTAHPAIKTHNWLVFDDATPTSFENSLQQVVRVLTMDVNHIRLHTRYLVRAREWEDSEKDHSYLLRGSDAYEADNWLNDSDDKAPHPTELHHEFVRESLRQVERDEIIKQQQRTIQFVDRTTWFPFLTTLLAVTIYIWFTYPNADLKGFDRATLAFGGGIVGGIMFAAMALYADELVRVRFDEKLHMRIIMSVLYGAIFGLATCGVLQVVYFGVPISFPSITLAGLILASGFIWRAIFKLKGWQAVLPTVLGIVVSSTLTMEMGNGFRISNLQPVFYFEDWTQYWVVGVAMAVLVSIGAYGYPLWETFQDWLQEKRTSELELDAATHVSNPE